MDGDIDSGGEEGTSKPLGDKLNSNNEPFSVEKKDALTSLNILNSAGVKHACPKCGKLLRSKYKLRIHLDRKFDCNVKQSCSKCEKPFKSKYKLRMHQNRKYNCNSKQACPKCEKPFNSNYKLRMHLNRKFNCAKKLSLNRGVKMDLSIESMVSNETDNSCRKCGKSFPGKWKLNKHLNRKFDCAKKRSLRVGSKASPATLS